MISDADLEAMRETVNQAMPEDIIEIHRPTVVPDGAGGSTIEYSVIGLTTGRLAPAPNASGSIETLIAGSILSTTQWSFTLPALTDVQLQDRLVLGPRTFEVSFVSGPRSWEISRRVLSRELL